MRILAATLIILLTACSPGKSDAQLTRAVKANITGACADGSFSFCDALVGGASNPDVSVQSSVLFANIEPMYAGQASTICSALAAMHYDANGHDLGYTGVTIVAAGSGVAECRTP